MPSPISTDSKTLPAARDPGVDYTRVQAILIGWSATSKGQEQLRDQRMKLGKELEAYRFSVEMIDLESQAPQTTLFQRFSGYVQQADQETLLIVYYGGHGDKNNDNQLIWLRDTPNSPGDLHHIPQVNWSALQTIFMRECASPVLFLLDCCYAGASVHRERSSGTVIALTATGFHDIAPARGEFTFTTVLTKILKEKRGTTKKITAVYLKNLASAHLNSPDSLQQRGSDKRVTPDYIAYSDGTITLKVLPDISKNSREFVAETERQLLKAAPDETAGPFAISSPHTPQKFTTSSPVKAIEAGCIPKPLLPTTLLSPPSPSNDDASTSDNSKTATTIDTDFPLPPRRDSRLYGRTTLFMIEVEERAVDSDRYKYLSLERNTIRILQLIPTDSKDDPLICSFRSLKLSEMTTIAAGQEFTAISWSHETDQTDRFTDDAERNYSLHFKYEDRVTIVDALSGSKSSLPVPTNLLLALRQLREKKIFMVWADQLCIDWKNGEEVQIQEDLIPDIFRKASNTAVWLGNDSEDSSVAMNFIPELLNLDLIDKLVREDSTPRQWQALINLMKRRYFSRRWVVLELILARRAVLHCGSDTVDWTNFGDAAVILGSRYDEVELLTKRTNGMDSLVDPRSLAAYSIVVASREHFRRHGSGTSLTNCNLEMLVSRLPALQSLQPAAVIYALVPLATDREIWLQGQGHGSESEILKVFIRFVTHCVSTSGALDIICRPWAPVARKLHGLLIRTSRRSDIYQYGTIPVDLVLPTWIRQVNHLPFGEGGMTGRKNGDLFVGYPSQTNYTAARSTIATPKFGDLYSVPCMTVNGIVVGHIKSLMNRSVDGTLQTDWIQLFQQSSPVFNNNILDHPVKHWGTFVPDYVWRTLVADRGPGGTLAPLWYHQACRYWLEKYPDQDITTTLIRDSPHPLMALEFIRRMRSVIWNRTLFTIDLGGRTLFGLGPPGTKIEYEICVLYGCSVPVVLWPIREGSMKGSWKLCGECFVYGLMDGEAMQMGEAFKTQEFLIL